MSCKRAAEGFEGLGVALVFMVKHAVRENLPAQPGDMTEAHRDASKNLEGVIDARADLLNSKKAVTTR